MIAEPSDATMNSPLPTPTISGLPLRAATSVSGSFSHMTTRPYAPVTSRNAACTAFSISPSYNSPMSIARTSVSVWLLNTCPLSSRRVFKGCIVLDDAVVDDADAVAVIGVRVRVGIGDAAVGRPSRVPHTNRATKPAANFQAIFEVGNASDALLDRDLAALEDGDARGVVPAILEALEPFEDQVLAVLAPDVGDDSAHDPIPLEPLRPQPKHTPIDEPTGILDTPENSTLEARSLGCHPYSSAVA